MSDRSANAPDAGHYHLVPGMPVYDKSGEMVGTLDTASLEQSYLIVQPSAKFPHDLYVPHRSIARVEPDGIYLKQSRRTLRGKRYMTPPESETAASAEPARTAPAGGEAASTRSAAEPAAPASEAGATDGRVADERDSRVAVPLVREDLAARRSAEQVGTVRLHKTVETEERAIAVPVSHDEVIVEHIPPDQVDANASIGANELLIPIMEEQLVVQKRMVVKEYVRVRKRQVVERRQVREPVRREALSVQEQRSAAGTGGQEWPLVREMREPGAAGTEGADATTNA